MKRVALLTVMIVSAVSAQGLKSLPGSTAADNSRLRILLVVAHPDDEYDLAATVYRITTELHGVADEIITNGESGYCYGSLAERYYGVVTGFGYKDWLSYQIVVDWVIAEHKSQGLFQTRCLQDRHEFLDF